MDVIAEFLLTLAVIIASLMTIIPRYRVWALHMAGRADLARAQNDQMIQLATANGRLAAATKNKEAAIIEAEAVAAQISTIGQQLTAHDLYLRWQWIRMMEESGADKETIYVPTEANLPILEATRSRSRCGAAPEPRG